MGNEWSQEPTETAEADSAASPPATAPVVQAPASTPGSDADVEEDEETPLPSPKPRRKARLPERQPLHEPSHVADIGTACGFCTHVVPALLIEMIKSPVACRALLFAAVTGVMAIGFLFGKLACMYGI